MRFRTLLQIGRSIPGKKLGHEVRPLTKEEKIKAITSVRGHLPRSITSAIPFIEREAYTCVPISLPTSPFLLPTSDYPRYSTTAKDTDASAAFTVKTYKHPNDSFTLRGTLQPRNGIALSQFAELHRTFTQQDVRAYGKIVGDDNPIHSIHPPSDTDDRQGRKPRRERTAVVHGMLTASLFSAIFGTLIPGSIYRSQDLRFKSPVFCDERVVGRIRVTRVKNLRGRGALVTCDTTVLRYGGDGDEDGGVVGTEEDMEECVVGEAEVWLPDVVGVEG